MSFRTFVCLLLLSGNPIWAESLKVAVAANFRHVFEQIAQNYQAVEIEAIYGSSGLLYAQISQGAPFALFLSADKKRPQALAEAHKGQPQSLTQYASGLLVLWNPTQNPKPQNLLTQRYAMANPELAPYGLAAKICMQTLNLWDRATIPILGTSIAQTLNFVATGAVANAWIAKSQTIQLNIAASQLWQPPINCYQEIAQYALVLHSSQATQALTFLQHLTSKDTQRWLQTQGYGKISL